MEKKDSREGKIGRREFLAFVGGMIGAISLGNFARVETSFAAATGFPELQCGDKGTAGKRILVAYASKHGSTGGVAEAIGKELCNRGVAVDVLLAINAPPVDAYHGVVVGSPIYRGRWLPEAVDFLKTKSEVLSKVPVAYFQVCMTVSQPTEKNLKKAVTYLDAVLKGIPQIKPVATSTFAGAVDYSKLSAIEKLMLKSRGTPEGDFRDWKAIQAWAAGTDLTKLLQ
jgi:menaquinone-dependent protoporphyrinogen oxidase